MKVISRGDSEWKLEVSCKNCESVLVLEVSDIRYGKFYSGMDAEVSMDYYVDCPVCSQHHFLPAKKLPRWVQYDAESRYVPSKD